MISKTTLPLSGTSRISVRINLYSMEHDTPSAVTVQVLVPPFVTTDHPDLSFSIQTLFSIPDKPILQKVFLKSRAICASVNANFNNCLEGSFPG